MSTESKNQPNPERLRLFAMMSTSCKHQPEQYQFHDVSSSSRPHAPSNHGGRPAMMAIPTTTIQMIVSGMKTFHPSRMIWS